MFRMWAKEFSENHMLRDMVVELPGSDRSRTKKVLAALEQVCREFDLQPPIWLDANIREFQRISRTRFRKDSFIEEVPFDYLEIQMLEEDE